MGNTPAWRGKEGAGAWLETFVAGHQRWLREQARKLCGSSLEMEDLVQETLLRFVETFGRAETSPDEKACSAWLFTTLANTFCDMCRRRRTRERGDTDPAVEEVTLPVRPEVRPAYDDVTDEQLAAAVRALSPRLRAAYELHAQGKRYQEIAAALGIPMGTVAKRLHDARLRLRARLLAVAAPEAQ